MSHGPAVLEWIEINRHCNGDKIMRLCIRLATRLLPALAACLGLSVAHPAAAGECDAWKAEVWDVEGGRALTAHVCMPASGDDRQPMLYLQCGEEGAFALRYDDGGAGNPPDGNPEWSGRVVFSDGKTSLDVTMFYEAMDGVLYAADPFSGPLVALLKGGSTVTLTPDDKTFETRQFTLKGSSGALARLAPTCGAR